MNVICTGALCVVENPSIIATGQENYSSITFSFNSDWDNLTKTVYFKKNNIEITVELINNSCYLPIELTENFGNIYIGVIGKQVDIDGIFPDETIVLTTNRIFMCSLLQGPHLTIDEIKARINLISGEGGL